MIVTGQQSICDIFGVAPKTITEWQADGMPVHVQGGRGTPSQYDTVACIEWRVSRLACGPDAYDLTTERARLAHHQANIAALDEDVKRKTLIPAELVKSKWQDMIASTRARLLSMPTRIAASCVGRDEVEIEHLAREIVNQSLDELARGNGVD
jgi:terminase small subunit / prophage DNA-packing protein